MLSSIAIFGAASSGMSRAFYDAAHSVGQLIAQAGCSLVFGGGDSGMMGACARGAHDAGGRVVGVIPEALHQPGIAYSECDELIVTRDLRDRMETMERISDAFVVLPGGIGTMYELFEVLTLNQLQYVSKCVVLLNVDRYYESFANMMETMFIERCAPDACRGLYAMADTPLRAINAIQEWKPAPPVDWRRGIPMDPRE